MAHEVETMAWAHEVPWHGLGSQVEGKVTTKEMLKAAGLDWEVKKYNAFIEVDGERVDLKRHALVRSKDKKVLTITGDLWKPFQNKEAMEFFREYCEVGGATLETAGALRGGRIIWALARVAAGFTINKKDHVKAYILLVWTHEVGQANSARITSIRVVCANTLAAAGGVKGRGAQYRQSHIRPFDIKAAQETIQLAQENMAHLKMEARALTSLKMSEFDTVRFLARYFQPAEEEGVDALSDKNIQALLDDPSLRNHKLQGVLWATDKAPGHNGGHGWGVLNGVTYWVDHMAGRERDTRLFNAWLGDNARLKQEVKSSLLEMVS